MNSIKSEIMMKSFLLFYCFLFTVGCFAQEKFTEADARQVIDTFFEGFHKGDTVQMRSVLAPVVGMQSVHSSKDGKHFVSDSKMDEFILAIANRPETDKWEERLLDYRVQIDGNLAHVWTPYEFWFNGNFSHCGANAFTLAKMDDGWKIIHLIDSRRKNSCGK
ncbi:MAG: nuclear transport factor 2 family protein [Flavobacteriaceae bacterium]|nr:nuclear transport factor 2 family protein [Flavobacteriaceae bacterium]